MSLNKNLSVFAQSISSNGEAVDISSNTLTITANAFYFSNGAVVGSQIALPAEVVANSYLQDTFSPTVTITEQGTLQYEFDNTTANSFAVPTTSNTFVHVYQNGIKLAANLFSVPNTTHVNVVDTPDSNDLIQIVVDNANSFTLQYSSADINRLGLASNTYIQNQVLQNYLAISTAGLEEYQFTNTTANSFAIPNMNSNTTVQVWKSGIKLSNTLWSALKVDQTHVYLVDTPQTNDTISILTFTPNTYNMTFYSNSVIMDAYVTNNYVSGTFTSNNYVDGRFTSNNYSQSAFDPIGEAAALAIALG